MLQNKCGIIFGVANKRSIAWATAQALHEAGAKLAFAYQGERLKENVERLTKEYPQIRQATVDSQHDVPRMAPDALVAHVRDFIGMS